MIHDGRDSLNGMDGRTRRPMRPKPLMPTLQGPAVLALASAELTMLMNSGLSEAPPTRKPSMSGLVASSLAFLAVGWLGVYRWV